MTGYFVMQCKLSKTIEVRNKLQAEFGESAVVAPSFKTIVRVGRARVRTEVEKPVLGASCLHRPQPKRPAAAESGRGSCMLRRC